MKQPDSANKGLVLTSASAGPVWSCRPQGSGSTGPTLAKRIMIKGLPYLIIAIIACCTGCVRPYTTELTKSARSITSAEETRMLADLVATSNGWKGQKDD